MPFILSKEVEAVGMETDYKKILKGCGIYLKNYINIFYIQGKYWLWIKFFELKNKILYLKKNEKKKKIKSSSIIKFRKFSWF